MIVVTGGAGFIGSNVVRALNARGESDILVVDEQHMLATPINLADCRIAGVVDKNAFRARLQANTFDPPRGVVHLGACTDTTERNLDYLMDNNFGYSRDVLDYCRTHRCPLVYASSAAVYGTGREFRESPECEKPVNGYGVSKLEFDRHVRRQLHDAAAPIAGLRFFNVYGPRETHKGRMASVAFHLHRQLRAGDCVRLFRGSGGYDDGEQQRDFIHVDDVVQVVLWFVDHPGVNGIYNVGTGVSRSFNDVARAVLAWHGRGRIEYVPFPRELDGSYQSYTQADIGALRGAGYSAAFLMLEDGIRSYLDWLTAAKPCTA